MSLGHVYLVGAGPGQLDLITVRGRKLLEKCDCVVYDYLANPELLQWVPEHAHRVYVGKIPDAPHKTQDEINEILVEQAQSYKRVVRLKGGDPLIFGRGGEEAAVLDQAGIAFDIIPGVTSGLAAATYAGIPLTHRDSSSSVTFMTGREKKGKERSAHDWKALAGSGTLVCYMGVKALPSIAENLLANGKDPQTPAAIIEWATYDRQRVVIGTLESLPAKATAEHIGNPSIIVIGPVVSCREEMAWFDKRPLFGKTVLVTRSRKQEGGLVDSLRHVGATVVSQPSMHIELAENTSAVDDEIEQLQNYQWIAFTSQNAVEHFCDRLFEKGYDARQFASCKIAAVGPATERALHDYGLRADIIPKSYDAEHLAESLSQEGVHGTVLLPQADNARTVLVDGLRAAGFAVQTLVVYRSVTEENSIQVQDKQIDAVTFASSVTVSRFITQVGKEGLHYLRDHNCAFIAIGQQTAEAMEAASLPVTEIADEATLSGLVQATISALSDDLS